MPLLGQSLADGQLAASETTIYTVPAGTVGFIKWLSVVNVGGGNELVVIKATRSGGTAREIFRADLSTSPLFAQVIGKDDGLTLSTGDSIQGQATNAASVDFFISGGQDGP